MNNEKNSVFSSFFSVPGSVTGKYLHFSAVVYAVIGIICAGLYMDVFGFVASVNAILFADVLLNSMIRGLTAVTLFTLLIDYLDERERHLS